MPEASESAGPSEADEAFERGRRRIGWIVFLALAALTIFEYVAAVRFSKVLLWMIPIAIVKAALIVVYFMHIRELWNPEEEI